MSLKISCLGVELSINSTKDLSQALTTATSKREGYFGGQQQATTINQ